MDLSETTRLEMVGVRAVLCRARALIAQPEDWWRGGPSPGRECVALAIMAANPVSSEQDKLARSIFARANGIELSDWDLIGIYRWNDAPGRTHAEVLAAFDLAIGMAQ